jgi:hypothetical protein
MIVPRDIRLIQLSGFPDTRTTSLAKRVGASASLGEMECFMSTNELLSYYESAVTFGHAYSGTGQSGPT